MTEQFLLVKRGLYYRPDSAGYTGIKSQAGRYPKSRAMPEAGVTAIHEDEAPEYSECCAWDLRLKDQISELSKALDRLVTLTEFELSGTGNEEKQPWFEAVNNARVALAKARGDR